MAAAYDVGTYWSSSGVYDPNVEKLKSLSPLLSNDNNGSSMIINPAELKEFLKYPSSSSAPSTGDEAAQSIDYLCLGWMFVGEFYDTSSTTDDSTKKKKWPTSRRKPLEEDNRVEWK